MPRLAQPRLDVGPLLALTPGTPSTVLRIEKRRVLRWKAEGVPVREADRVAVRLGRHPGEIWGHAWEQAEEAYAAALRLAKRRRARYDMDYQWRRNHPVLVAEGWAEMERRNRQYRAQRQR